MVDEKGSVRGTECVERISSPLRMCHPVSASPSNRGARTPMVSDKRRTTKIRSDTDGNTYCSHGFPRELENVEVRKLVYAYKLSLRGCVRRRHAKKQADVILPDQTKRSALVDGTLGGIAQGNEFAERIIFLGEWNGWVSTDDGHNFAAVNPLQDEVALIHCDHPIPLCENRIVGHKLYDACFHIPDTCDSVKGTVPSGRQQVRAVFVNFTGKFHILDLGMRVQSLP